MRLEPWRQGPDLLRVRGGMLDCGAACCRAIDLNFTTDMSKSTMRVGFDCAIALYCIVQMIRVEICTCVKSKAELEWRGPHIRIGLDF